MFEWRIIQEELRKHFGAVDFASLVVPDGDYLVPVYDEYFRVRVRSNRMEIVAEEWDGTTATRIGGIG